MATTRAPLGAGAYGHAQPNPGNNRNFAAMHPRERLAFVEAALKEAEASRRRRRRLDRSARYGPISWLVVMLAALLCAGVGLWNYRTAASMLSLLEERWQALPDSAQSGEPTGRAAAPWSWERTRLMAGYLAARISGKADPLSIALPGDPGARARILSHHALHYLAYQTLGAWLVAAGTVAFLAAGVMAAAGRR